LKPRLYLDEDVNPALAQLLREAGYDVISAHEVGAIAETDREQLQRATADGRAILTYNYYDFEVIARRGSGGPLARGDHHLVPTVRAATARCNRRARRRLPRIDDRRRTAQRHAGAQR